MDTSNVTTFRSTTSGSSTLKCFPLWDFSSAVAIDYMCNDCEALEYVPTLTLPVLETMNSAFYGCKALTSLTLNFANHQMLTSNMVNAFKFMTALTDLTFINASIKVDCDYSLLGPSSVTTTTTGKNATTTTTYYTYSISVDSVVNFFEALEDNTGEDTQYTVSIPTVVYEQLTDEQKAIITDKNILLKSE